MRILKPIAITCLLSFSSTVLAQTPLFQPAASSSAEDVITLRDGTILRGHVTTLKPGVQLELVLLDGRTETIAWSDVLSSVGPSFPEAPHRPGEKFLQPAPGRVPVVLEAPRPVAVGVLSSRPRIGQDTVTVDNGVGVAQWTTNYQSAQGAVVCAVTPCRIWAQPGALRLQISGDDVLSYAPDVDVPPGGLAIALRAPSATQRRTGTMLMTLGVGGALAGAITMGVGAAVADGRMSVPDIGGGTRTIGGDDRPVFYGLGGALLGAGVISLVTGAVLFARNQLGVESIRPIANGFSF